SPPATTSRSVAVWGDAGVAAGCTAATVLNPAARGSDRVAGKQHGNARPLHHRPPAEVERSGFGRVLRRRIGRGHIPSRKSTVVEIVYERSAAVESDPNQVGSHP